MIELICPYCHSLSFLIVGDVEIQGAYKCSFCHNVTMFNNGTSRKRQIKICAKCKDCKWLGWSEKTSIGYRCQNPERIWRSDTAPYHFPSAKACKKFERKEENETQDKQ